MLFCSAFNEVNFIELFAVGSDVSDAFECSKVEWNWFHWLNLV